MVLKILLLLFLHGFFFWCLGNGQACNSFGFICTSCTSLQLCTSGVPSGVNLTCATNSYCDSTTSSMCSTTVCTTEPEPFYDCVAAGRFAVTNNCSQYIFCSNSTTLGILVPTLFECPNGTIFNPNSALCVLDSDYTCPTAVTTTTVAPAPGTTCTTAGRFPNITDSTCQAYYLCTLETNGTYTLTSLDCPTTTVFNLNTQKCVASTAYTCPF